MCVAEHRHARPCQLLPQVVLGAVDHRQVRPQTEDTLEIGIEQCADARQPVHLGRLVVVAADGHDTRPGADGKEDLCRRGHQRHNPLWRRLRGDDDRHEESQQTDQEDGVPELKFGPTKTLWHRDVVAS